MYVLNMERSPTHIIFLNMNVVNFVCVAEQGIMLQLRPSVHPPGCTAGEAGEGLLFLV